MKRLKYVIIIILMIGGAWILALFLSSQNKDDLRKPVEKKVSKESFIKVKNELQFSAINTNGRMYAFNKVEIFAEVSGVLEESSKSFKAGHRYKKGNVMININSDVYLNSLLAKKSNLLSQLSFLLADAKVDFPDSYQKWQLYLDNFDLKKPLLPLPEDLSSRETMYLASHNILNLFYDIKYSKNDYTKLEYNYTSAINYIYSKEEIELELNRQDIDVEQEYCCNFTSGRNSVFGNEFVTGDHEIGW